MATPLRALILEDSADDADLLVRELRHAGYEPAFKRLDNREGLIRALDDDKWDVIISDYFMPRFSALDAIKVLREKNLDIPFIVVSGSTGEDTAVSTMKAGAHDYIMKGNLARLAPAIEREMREVLERGMKRRAQQSLQESEERYRDLFENAHDMIQSTDSSGRFIFVNKSWLEITGYEWDDLKGLTMSDIVSPKSIKDYHEMFGRAISGKPQDNVTMTLLAKDGREIEVEGNIICGISNGVRVSCQGVFHDITRHKQMEESLRKFSRAIEQSPAAVIITGAGGDIEYVNPKFTELTGYTQEEVVGKNPRLLKSGEHDTGHYKRLWETVSAGKEWRGELRNKKKNGELFWVSASISAIKNSHVPITHFLAIEEDITERKKWEEELKKAKEAAEAANRAKSSFVANVSHEIRTPMTAIIGAADLLEQTALNEEQQKYVRISKSAGGTLFCLINDILDLSKIEAQRLELAQTPFDLNELMAKTLEFLAIEADKKKIELSCRAERDVPVSLEGDPDRLRQIIVNLVGNALKFTEKGGIYVSVKNTVRPETGHYDAFLEFSVRDTGIGIAPEQITRIFDLFTQANATIFQKYGGTGLGLAISKHLAELMGGKIWVESKPGEGSTFFFTAGFKIGAAEGHLPVSEPEPSAGTGEPGLVQNILLAEDSSDTAVLIKAYLDKKTTCRTETAENGKIAVEKIKSGNYRLVLMDMLMPEMDGYTAARLIREWEKKSGGHIPIIALTARALKEDIQKSLEAGCDAYVSKPIDMGYLTGIIKKHLKEGVKTA